MSQLRDKTVCEAVNAKEAPSLARGGFGLTAVDDFNSFI
jgi:hypothetical protein